MDDYGKMLINYFDRAVTHFEWKFVYLSISFMKVFLPIHKKSGGELLELRLLNTQLVDTFWPFRAVFTFFYNCSSIIKIIILWLSKII
jgi:hypothetical protein